MAAIQRQRVVWTGFPGSPGLSTFYFTDAAPQQGALRAFLAAVAGSLPNDVTLTLQPGGDVIEDSTGVITGVWAGTLQTPITPTGSAVGYAAPVGMLHRWETLKIVGGRRLRGRTYLVPARGDAYQSDGSLLDTVLAGQLGASSAFIASVTPNLLVWQRPRAARTAYVDGRGIPHKAVSGRLGTSAVVVTASMPDKVVVLRSRRD